MEAESIYCCHCEEKIRSDDYIEDLDYGNVYCNLQCKGAEEQNKAEAAWESYLGRFYGGEVVTQEEQYRKAWEDKRKM